jgi:tRNA (guanine37-N1)-methyltransferase
MKVKRVFILTIFPEFTKNITDFSIIRKAILRKKLEIEVVDFRDFAKKRQVDDYPFGGGGGMVLKVEPIVKGIEFIKTNYSLKETETKVILLSPQGKIFTQKKALLFARDKNNYIFVCGHYEGVDERIKNFIDQEISIGNYVLCGGEMAAMVITDCISRLITGVISKESLFSETHNKDNYFDHASFTRPRSFMNFKVPEVLLNGNHKLIDE